MILDQRERVATACYEASVLADVLRALGSALINDETICGTGIVLLTDLLQERLGIISEQQDALLKAAP